MPALVGDHGFEAEVVRVGIALEGFGVDCQQILACQPATTVLGTAGLAVNMAILDAPDEPQFPRNLATRL